MEVRGGLSLILQYIDQHITDEEEKVKLYPMAGLGFARELHRQGKDQQAADFLEDCISLMIRRGVLEHMIPILTLDLQLLEAVNGSESKRKERSRQLDALREMCSHFGQSTEESCFCFHVDSDLSLNYELVARIRRTRRMTQELLSQNVCTQEALSRIENGRMNLTGKTFLKLSQALQANYDVSGLSILTDDFSVLEACGTLTGLYLAGEYDRAEEVLNRVEEGDLEDCPENRQYLMTQRIWIQLMREEIEPDQALELYREALSLTLPKGEEGVGGCVLTHRELVLVSQMTIVYYRQGHPEQSVEILKRILKNFHESRMLPLSHIQRNSLVIGNLSMFLETTKQWHEAFDLALRNVELNFPMGHMTWIIRGLGTLGSAGLELGNPEAKRYFRWAFCLSQLAEDKRMVEILKEFSGEECREWETTGSISD